MSTGERHAASLLVGALTLLLRPTPAGDFAKMCRLLRPGGLMMNHSISAGSIDAPQLDGGMGDFIDRYIFPGGQLEHVSVMLDAMTRGKLEPVDAECLRPHYARTLWHGPTRSRHIWTKLVGYWATMQKKSSGHIDSISQALQWDSNKGGLPCSRFWRHVPLTRPNGVTVSPIAWMQGNVAIRSIAHTYIRKVQARMPRKGDAILRTAPREADRPVAPKA